MSQSPQSEHDELRQALIELARAQARADARMDQLAARMDEVAAAQAHADARMDQLAARMDEVAAAQARADARMDEVAAAQASADARMDRLTERVDRLTERMDQLTARVDQLTGRVDALARGLDQLSRTMHDLVGAVERLQKQVGGLSEAIGGDIEDAALTVVYYVLQHDLGWKVHSLEGSTWQKWDDRGEEVDFFGFASDPARPGTTVWIVGEAKTNLTASEVDRFAAKVRRARDALIGDIYALCFCRRAHPDVQQRIKELGLQLMFTTGRLLV